MQSFDAFRVVGSICGPVPISSTILYGTPVLMVATGRTFQLYKGKELAMMRGGPTFQDPVRAVAQVGKYRVVAEGPRLHIFVHHKALWVNHHEAATKPAITHLLAQDDLLFSVGEDKRVVVWELKTGKVLQEHCSCGTAARGCVCGTRSDAGPAGPLGSLRRRRPSPPSPAAGTRTSSRTARRTARS